MVITLQTFLLCVLPCIALAYALVIVAAHVEVYDFQTNMNKLRPFIHPDSPLLLILAGVVVILIDRAL